MKEVLINISFRDKYTDKVYAAGKKYPMTEERVKEIKEINPNFVTVVGEVKSSKSKSDKEKKTEEKNAENQSTGTDTEEGEDGAEGEDADGKEEAVTE